ncbi:MAG: helix-turn-helix domain-containing protein [Oceanococcus sp.]
MTAKDWKGDIVFSHSSAIFRGHVGENKMHSHWAAQLTISLNDEIEFETTSGLHSSKAVYLSSKTQHRLISGLVCSIYFDPLSTSTFSSLDKETTQGWTPLSVDELPPELRTIDASTNLEALLNSKTLSSLDLATSLEPRFQKLIHTIKSQLSSGEDTDREALAKIVHLSPTRFSHWFVERTGVPLRSYKKWLKLRVAMDALLDGKNPMEAAMLGGFSDLAHLSRAFSESFGLTYRDAQRAWENLNEN